MDGQIQTAPREYALSGEESKRIRILKIWFTVMVVFIHSYTENVNFAGGTVALQTPVWLEWMKYILSQVVARCAVPGFFFLSAVLLYRRPFTWAGNLRKKARTLLVPYMLINTLWIGLYFTAQHIGPLSGYFAQPGHVVADWTPLDWVKAYVGVNRLGPVSNDPLVYPLWFMRDLMVLNVLAVFIRWLIDRLPRLIFLGLAAMRILDIATHIPVLRTDALVFFCLGYYFVKYDLHFRDVDRLDPVLLAGFYGISVVLVCLAGDGPARQAAGTANILLGFAFFLRSTTKITSQKWRKRLLPLAGYAMPVYLFHEMNLTILKKLMIRLLPTNVAFQTIEYFGIPAVIIALCIAGSWLLKKCVPRLYGVLTGGRTM